MNFSPDTMDIVSKGEAFMNAVLIGMNPAAKDLKAQALAHFNEVKNSVDGWKMCSQLFHLMVVNKGKDEVFI